MEKYVKPSVEIVEIPSFAVITADTCPTKMPEIEAGFGGSGD